MGSRKDLDRYKEHIAYDVVSLQTEVFMLQGYILI